MAILSATEEGTMTEKYIDLLTKIARDKSLGGSHVRCARDVVEWLDDHPDQVPGRTITASEFDEAVESCATEDYTVPPHTFAARLGVVCVPDPELTNAELLVEDLAGIYGANLPWTAKIAISEALVECGWVKAPGGD